MISLTSLLFLLLSLLSPPPLPPFSSSYSSFSVVVCFFLFFFFSSSSSFSYSSSFTQTVFDLTLFRQLAPESSVADGVTVPITVKNIRFESVGPQENAWIIGIQAASRDVLLTNGKHSCQRRQVLSYGLWRSERKYCGWAGVIERGNLQFTTKWMARGREVNWDFWADSLPAVSANHNFTINISREKYKQIKKANRNCHV